MQVRLVNEQLISKLLCGNMSAERSSLVELKQKIDRDDALKQVQLDDDFLIKFLIACNFSVKATLYRVKRYLNFCRQNGNLFMSATDAWVKLKPRLFMAFDQTGLDGEPIVYIRPSNWQPSKCGLDEAFATIVPFSELAVMQADSVARQTGFTVLVDMRGFTLEHLRSLRSVCAFDSS